MMQFKKIRVGLAIGMLFASQQVCAITMTAIDDAKWQFHQERQLCVLEHNVAEQAVLRFSSQPQGSLSLALQWLSTGPQGASPQGGHAVLTSRGAPWRNAEPTTLGQGHWQQQVLRLNGSADAALNALASGLWLEVSELGSSRQWLMPSVHFQQPYQDFRLCRGEAGMERSADGRQLTLHFQSGAKQLSTSQIQQLNQLAQQVSNNPQLSRLQIDAFTDNSGSPELNLRLSRMRALQVVEQLRRTLSVLPMDMHAHGQASPLSDNATPAGRYQNRRVTITLLPVETAL